MTDRTNGQHPAAGAKQYRWIIFVTGPTACGKTTIARYVAEKINARFLEGDDFHPKANIEKMHKGIPLTDADRAAWLQAIEEHATMHPQGAAEHQPLVVTCSALKHEYRQTLHDGSERADDVRVGFLFLDAPEAVLRERAQKRQGHFAGANLVHSQFEILEKPVGEEGVMIVNVNQPMEEAEREALEAVRRMIGS